MSSEINSAVVALVVTIAAPAAAWGWGVPGCANLPEYNRALGALQGMTSACGMSVEQARRIITAHDSAPGPDQRVAPVARDGRHHRRNLADH
jgi:bacterioferritin-associated ferredoxin